MSFSNRQGPLLKTGQPFDLTVPNLVAVRPSHCQRQLHSVPNRLIEQCPKLFESQHLPSPDFLPRIVLIARFFQNLKSIDLRPLNNLSHKNLQVCLLVLSHLQGSLPKTPWLLLNFDYLTISNSFYRMVPAQL